MAGATASALAQQPGWQHLNLQHDGVFGVSTTRAYRELLKGKRATTVIVGILDTGVDTTQEDLRSVLWRDPKTGTHGWNYIGPETGREDVTQLVDWERKGLDRDTVHNSRLTQLGGAFLQSLGGVSGQLAGKQERLKGLIADLQQTQTVVDTIVGRIGKTNPTVADFKSYQTRNEEESTVVGRIVQRLRRYPNWSAYRTTEVTGVIARAQYHLTHGLNIENLEPDTASGDADVNPDILGPARSTNESAHGTHVAGIIAAVRNNGIGMDGIADHVQILAVKDNGPFRELRDTNLAKAIRFAVDHGAKVLNLSFGKMYSWNKGAVDAAVKYAMQKDVLIVHGAGNDGRDLDPDIVFPNPTYADHSGTAAGWLEVGASTWKNNETLVAQFSNYGKEKVDVFAPGVQIYSTLPENRYESWDGTSMAAPVVTGIAALIREYYPKLTAPQVKEIIVKSAVRTPYLTDKCRSGGVVNAYEALKLAAQY